jgi:hypothetical protein
MPVFCSRCRSLVDQAMLASGLEALGVPLPAAVDDANDASR